MKKFVLCMIACVVLTGFVFSQGMIVIQPDSSSEWMKGKMYSIQWRISGKAPAYVKLTIYSPENRRTRVIMKRTVNNGKWKWTVPQDIPPGNYEIRLSTEDGKLLARSRMFKISEPVKMMRSVTRVRTSAVRSLPPIDPEIKGQHVRVEQNLNPRTKNRLDNMAKSLYDDLMKMGFSEFHQVALNKVRKEFPNASEPEMDVVMFYVMAEIELKLRQEVEDIQKSRDFSSGNSRAMFENMNQKTTQLWNLLSTVLKTMKEMRLSIIRNLR